MNSGLVIPVSTHGRSLDAFSNRWTRWRRLKKYPAANPEMPAPITATVFIHSQEYQYVRTIVNDLSMTNH